jgi:hypothetical protein
MKTFVIATITIGTMAYSLIAAAQTTASLATRPPAYDRLGALVGRWTIKGREDKFLETCRWFDGNFHLICESENKRADGTFGHSMSILGYLPAEDRYTYLGIGSKGRNETMSGTFSDGVFEFTSETVANGRTVFSRVRMGPFSGREVSFVAESSSDRVSWAVDAAFTYIRPE